jgi:hypothetical protein
VRKTVEKQSCAAWRKRFPGLTQTDFARLTENLKLWRGEDYGHKNSVRTITIADTCFVQQDSNDGNTRANK